MNRPFRLDVFDSITTSISSHGSRTLLELGSGPGFLAFHLCERLPGISLTLLDFANPMHALARAKLIRYQQQISFVTRDFKHQGWADDLGRFDCVFTVQAVHELRHKRHAVNLHLQVRELLSKDGIYLVCDHFHGEGGMQNDQLYMTEVEQTQALEQAGFQTSMLLKKGSLLLLKATGLSDTASNW